jgi:hypothetical protein
MFTGILLAGQSQTLCFLGISEDPEKIFLDLPALRPSTQNHHTKGATFSIEVDVAIAM